MTSQQQNILTEFTALGFMAVFLIGIFLGYMWGFKHGIEKVKEPKTKVMKPGDKVTLSITNEVLTIKNVKTFVASCYDESGNVVVKSIEVLNPVL